MYPTGLTHRAAPIAIDGFAIISVMIAMVLIFITLGAILNHRYTVESDRVEQSLVKVRAYWAMVGALDWTLAKCRNDGAAACKDFDDVATGFSAKYGGYFAQLNNEWIYSVNEKYTVSTDAADPAANGIGCADVLACGTVKLTVSPLVFGRDYSASVMPLTVGLIIGATGKSTVTSWERI
jgi:Tfp pilus assembly protein PilV